MKKPRHPVVVASYFLWQHAELLQQAEPSQHPASMDFPNEVPNVSNKRAARLNTPVVIFFMTILLSKVSFNAKRHWQRDITRLTRRCLR
jgi:hypothetical protein